MVVDPVGKVPNKACVIGETGRYRINPARRADRRRWHQTTPSQLAQVGGCFTGRKRSAAGTRHNLRVPLETRPAEATAGAGSCATPTEHSPREPGPVTNHGIPISSMMTDAGTDKPDRP